MTNDTHTTLSTINDVENIIQEGLEALRNAPLSDKITAALNFLAPEGFTPVIQLEEDGRKKRNTAAASNWSPENGEILIYFEPKAGTSVSVARLDDSRLPKSPVPSLIAAEQVDVSPDEVKQCCEALAEAEKAGKLFVALTWFRDKDLPRHHLPWTASAVARQKVLARAIESGAILLKKIPNPKSDFPTTTVSLNRSGEMQQVVTPRFRPVPVRGESISATIMRERGSL
jgi:hypothetical protein